MRWKPLVLFLQVASLALPLGPSLAQTLQPDLELARRLPPDSVAYLATASMPEVWAARKGGGFEQLVEQLGPFLAQQRDPNETASLDQTLGMPAEEAWKALGGSVSLGIGPLDPARQKKDGTLPLVARMALGDMAVFERLETRLYQALEKDWVAPRIEDWQGIQVRRFEKTPDAPLYTARAGGHFYLATDEALLRGAMGEPHERSLASAPRFQQAVREAGSGLEALAFVDAAPLIALAKQAAADRPDPDHEKTWQVFDPESVSHLVLSSRWTGKVAVLRGEMVYARQPRGLPGMFSGMGTPGSPALARIPAGWTMALALRVESFPALLDRLRILGREIGRTPEDLEGFEQVLQQAGKERGIELHAQFLSRLTGELAVALRVPDISPQVVESLALLGGALPHVRGAIVLGLNEGPDTARTVRVLLERGNVQGETVDHAGTSVRVLLVPGWPVSPAYALHGGWLVLGINRESVADILDQQRAGTAGLDSLPAWSRLPLAREANALTYLDLKRLMQIAGPITLALLQKQRPDLHPSSLPQPGELSALLEPELGALRLGKDRWTLELYASSGGSVPVGMTGIAAAIAIPSLLRSRMSANEARASGALMTLAAAQTDYNNNSSPHTFASSLELLRTGEGAGGVRYIDDELGKGVKSGYAFTLQAGAMLCNGVEGASGPSPDASDPESAFRDVEAQAADCKAKGGTPVYYAWRAEAHPIVHKRTGIRSFYIDETGILLGEDRGGQPGTPDMPEI